MSGGSEKGRRSVAERNRRQETGNRQQATGNAGSEHCRLPVAGCLSPVSCFFFLPEAA